MTNLYCIMCENYIKANKCKAFDQIPDEILNGKINHSKPLPSQKNKIVFKEINN